MISKRIPCQPGNDNYGRLANYIADASHQGEKALVSWCAGCWAGDDYELAIREVLDTQALNTRSAKEKTYHLVISFHPEDDRLTPELFKAMEERFAEALGLSKHQRHCGVHVNTENMHMHIAYNLIHPERLTREEPWHDYIKRDKLCRELEKEYGLVIDNGRERERGRGLGAQAATLEAHTGVRSFETYARSQAEGIMASLQKARSWEDVHAVFAVCGVEIRPRGAGLVVKNRYGKQAAKASSLDRGFALKQMIARFGAYQPPREKLPESERRYGPAPVQKAANRNRLWEEFLVQKQHSSTNMAIIRYKWEEKRKDLQRRPMARQTRAKLMKLTRQYEAEEIHAERMKRPPTNWLDYLRQKAARGDETALAVLRSRHEEITSEIPEERQRQARANYLAKKTSILEKTALSGRGQNRLAGVALMESLVAGVTSKISKYGSVIYTLPDGGKICDTGRRISFSPDARATALAYMAAKWNVKQRTPDRESGNVEYTLFNGQKVYDTGKNVIERPEFQKGKIRQKKREHSGLER